MRSYKDSPRNMKWNERTCHTMLILGLILRPYFSFHTKLIFLVNYEKLFVNGLITSLSHFYLLNEICKTDQFLQPCFMIYSFLNIP